MTETGVPIWPDVGFKINVGDKPAVNVATPVSPVVPVTVTVYESFAPDATMKDPETMPPTDIAQAALVSRPLGFEDSVHVVSARAKFEPETRIFAPATPEDGVTVTVAVTVKGTEIDPCCTIFATVLLIVTVRNPPSAVVATLYTPVSTPELLISQCEPVTSVVSKVGVKVIAMEFQQVSLIALVWYPVPDMVPVSPRLPLFGVKMKVDWTMNCSRKLSPSVPVAVILWTPPIAFVLTMKLQEPMLPLETGQLGGVAQSRPPPSGVVVASSPKVTLVSEGFQLEPVIVTRVPVGPKPGLKVATGEVGLPVNVKGAKAVGGPPTASAALIT
jgi:hypothetical protein